MPVNDGAWTRWSEVRPGDVVMNAPKLKQGYDLVLRVRRTSDGSLYMNLLCLETGARWSFIIKETNWVRRL